MPKFVIYHVIAFRLDADVIFSLSLLVQLNSACMRVCVSAHACAVELELELVLGEVTLFKRQTCGNISI